MNPAYSSTFRIRGLLAATGCLLAPAAARADTVLDTRGVFANVTVVGMDDGRIVFKFEDGRTLNRPVAEIKELSLSTSADPAADELTRGESLLKQKRHDQALALYERARRGGEREWVRSFATYRMIGSYDAVGRFSSAISCYLSLVDKHPGLIVPASPRNKPEADSIEAAKSAQVLDERSKTAQTDAQRRAIERIRLTLAGKLPPDPVREASSLPMPAAKTGADEADPTPDNPTAAPPPSEKTRGSRKVVAKTARPTAAVYRKIDAGKLPEAKAEIDAGLAAAVADAPSSRDVWWLAQAEYEMAAGHADLAGLSAMKLIAVMPDSAYYAEALLLAGKAYESIRPEKARSLYEECVKLPRADEDCKAKAAERLAELAKLDSVRKQGPGRPAP